MSKKKKTKAITSIPVSVVLPDNMSIDEMKHVIADGLMEFEERKKQKEAEAKELRRKEWDQAIGYKDFSEVKRPKRWFLQLGNSIAIMWKVCFIQKEHIKGDGITFGIMQMMLTAIFAILYLLFLLASALLFFSGVVGFCLAVKISPLMAAGVLIIIWLYGCLAVVFSGIFRVAGIEVSNIEDRGYLFGLLACIASIISATVAIVTVFTMRG